MSVIAGLGVGGVNALILTGVSAASRAFRHDAHTMAMIRAEGGVGEIFLLPLLLVVPGTACAMIGGVLGQVARWACPRMSGRQQSAAL